MKSISMKLFISIILLLSSSVFLYSETEKCSKITPEVIGKHIPISNFKILSTRGINGICEIIVNINGRIVPLYGSENYLISGDLFSERINRTRVKITDVNKKLFLDNKKAVDEAVVFEYIPKKIQVKTVVYMFTEPLCPYCHKAGNEVKRLADKYGFTVKVLLVSMHGERGRDKCIEAACRHFKAGEAFNLEQYNELEWKKEKVVKESLCEKGAALIKKIEELSERMGIDGVPCFYTDKGNYVSGADMPALERLVRGN